MSNIIHCAPLAAALSFSLAFAASGRVLLDAPGHVALEGAAVAAQGGEPGAAWRLVDWRGRDTGVSGAFDEAGKAELPPLPAGYYRMADGSKRATASLATLAVVASPSNAAGASTGGTPRPLENGPRRGSFFGADCAIDELHREFDCPWNGGDAIRTVADLAALAGFTHVRGRHNWSRMQPKPDTAPDCTVLAANAALFRERGIEVSGLFYGTPGWAGKGRPKGLPQDLGVLYRSCRDIAAAFGDEIHDWEFFNEPDIGFLSEPVWEYAAALKAASLGFKAGNPKAPVLCAGLCTTPKGFYLHGLLANGAASYFDAFNYHTYAAPSQYPSLIREIRSALGDADLPIWMSENGTNFEGPARLDSVRKGFKAHSPEQELVVAEFAPKSQIALQMQGLGRSFFFLLGAYSERGGGKDWGLLRRDGTAKPAYAALATLTREVGDARLLGALDTPAGLRAYLYEHADGSQTIAFWSESPLDTAAIGNDVFGPEPELARTWMLAASGISQGGTKAPGGSSEGDARRASLPSSGQSFRLVDLCGAVSELRPLSDGTLLLPATRFPAYVSGLHGLQAATKARQASRAESAGSAKPSAIEVAIVPRVVLDDADFEISNNKTLAVAKGDEPHLRVQFWNLSDATKTGTAEVAGVLLDGLPAEPFTIEPFGSVEFDCVPRPVAAGAGSSDATATLVLRGRFDGRETSAFSMPLFFEKAFLATCETEPLDWRDPAKWSRNDSADAYSVAWDEAEQAIRFDVEWTNPGVGRWFYPVLALSPRGEAAGRGVRGENFPGPFPLQGALRATFEVKTAQDKVENDFGDANFMLVRGKKGGSPGEWLNYTPPTGAWERRYVELSACPDLGEVDAIRLGANPRGMRLTFWVRNLAVLRPAAPAANTSTP